MARTRLLDASTAPISSQPYFQGGDPGPIVAALAQVPELVAPTVEFIGAALGPGAASTRHKEIAILRTSALKQCHYCTSGHTVASLDSGLTPEEVTALRGDLPLATVFPDPAELALIGWIDAMAGSNGPVPDQLWDDVRGCWPEHILVELSVTIGATLFLNRFATGFDLPTSPAVLDRLAAEGWT